MKIKLTFAIIFLLFNTVILSGRNLTYTTTGNDTLALTAISVSLPLAEDESYINDIPFDTKAVALKSLFFNLEKPEEEAYINDIPFDTRKIAATVTFSASNIHPDDEEYIDDIPFNTADVVEDYILNGCGIAATPSNVKCGE